MTRSLARLVTRAPTSVAIELQTLPALQPSVAIRQLTVEDAMRRRICQYRHGLSYAGSATMPECPSMCHCQQNRREKAEREES